MLDKTIFSVEVNTVSQQTRSKALRLLEDSKTAVVGVILMDITGGARTYIDSGAVRKMSNSEAYDFIHDKKCRWVEVEVGEGDYAWWSDCSRTWAFVDGGPEDNGVKYCQGCGREIENAERVAEKK